MINSKKLLADLQSKKTSRSTMVKLLEDDLRKRCDAEPEVDTPLKERYEAAKAQKRTALTYKAWRDDELTQIAVAWVLGCVFVRFMEDNELVETPKLSGPGERLRRARDEHELFFQRHPTSTEREFLLEVFEESGRLPGMREFFDKRHNPLWLAAPSGDTCRELWQFWQKTDPESGELLHDFTDPEWNTRFLGDLYQDLSEAARKKYALLQTPDFVEEFILDRTLTPAIETFGYREVRMIDPTCGSGHFLLGSFERIFRLWQQENPGENPRVLAQRALDAVNGVDLNPFAVAIARFRLLLAALQVCGVKRLADAPDFQISLAVGDSLIHGARFDSQGNPYVVTRDDMFGGDDAFKDEMAHFFDTEDSEALHRILGRQYHAVVGNPPYIIVRDKALNQLYRDRYDSCSGKYALSVPFMERFFDLALSSSGDGREPAGFNGQITSNSFMKRSFGKKLIEKHIPKWDLTHVLDTSGAYIPGHGTPTVILFGRNAKPKTNTLRTVMGIKGEPATPDDPANGKVWNAIVDQVDQAGSESDYVSSADTGRVKFHKHPWSLQGGGAEIIAEVMQESSITHLASQAKSIGPACFAGIDDVFLSSSIAHKRWRIPATFVRPFTPGDTFRDWDWSSDENIFAPYDSEHMLETLEPNAMWARHLWSFRHVLESVVGFGRRTRKEAGDPWYSWYRWIPERLLTRISIAFPSVSTHNHFVLLESGKAFTNRHAPLLILKNDDRNRYLSISGLLNSSAACFWMKQVFHNKGDSTDSKGARMTAVDLFANTYEFDGTKLKQFPVPADVPLTLARELDRQAQELSKHSPDALGTSPAALDQAAQTASDLRTRMISLQEELDWQCYRHYGLIENDDLEWPEDRLDDLPPLTLGERAFEIRMARQMAAGELETTWFERHKDAGSKAITELPAAWPDDYRALIERRLAFIESNKNINLIERPEYKRRWNTEPWAKRQKEALRKWLLARLEGYFCLLYTSPSPRDRG